MGEDKIIELLPIESERVLEESNSVHPMINTEISEWKEYITTFPVISPRIQ